MLKLSLLRIFFDILRAKDQGANLLRLRTLFENAQSP